jgi:hypothetical protein
LFAKDNTREKGVQWTRSLDAPQYDTEFQNIGANMRLRWTIKPGNDLFIVWNRGWQRQALSPHDIVPQSDVVAVKLRWTSGDKIRLVCEVAQNERHTSELSLLSVLDRAYLLKVRSTVASPETATGLVCFLAPSCQPTMLYWPSGTFSIL